MMEILAFPFHDWRKGQHESVRTRDGHLLRELGARPDIRSLLVVDRPVSLAERLVTRESAAVAGDRVGERSLGCGWRATLTSVADRTLVLDTSTPAMIGPARDPRGWWFEVFEDRHVHDALDWALDVAQHDARVAVAWTPAVAAAIEHVHPSALVFDSLDNWITHPILRRHAPQARAAYERLLPGAAAVFVPAEATRRELEPYAPHTVVLPNGVDLERFERPGPRPPDLPPSPLVGYVGKLGVRLDVDLIVATAALLPEVVFVFVGPALESNLVRPLRDRPNVRLVGDRRVEDVPAYLAAFDVAWIPHRVGEGETGGDLMKKYEYWAAGCQVVTTPVADLDAWASQLHIVRSPEEAVHAIKGLLDGSIAPTPTKVPADRTWPAIADRLIRPALDADQARSSAAV